MRTRDPKRNTTMPDGTIIANTGATCWDDAKAPPIPSNSTKYEKGHCGVCVSQSVEDRLILTLGTLSQYSIRIRDSTNHDMGTATNVTLAALDGATGDEKTSHTMIAGGKEFHLWTMRDPGFPFWAAVYMDFGGRGPADPFTKPPMVYSYAYDEDSPTAGLGMVEASACDRPTLSKNQKRVYFQCSFEC